MTPEVSIRADSTILGDLKRYLRERPQYFFYSSEEDYSSYTLPKIVFSFNSVSQLNAKVKEEEPDTLRFMKILERCRYL